MKRLILSMVGIAMIGGIIFYVLHHKITSVNIKTYIADGKTELFKDAQITDWEEHHGVHATYESRKTMEIANNPRGADTVILGSQYAVEVLQRNMNTQVKSEVVFQTSGIFLSWKIVRDGWEKKGWVRQVDGKNYLVGVKEVIQADLNGVLWKDAGVPEFYGPVKLEATDPRQSSSGLLFSALMAQVLAGENVRIDESNIGQYTPDIVKFFKYIGGGIKTSTGDLFSSFLKSPQASHPAVFVYESQLIEFAVANPKLWAENKDKICILYPVPTVWSSQYCAVITPNGERLFDVLHQPEVRLLAWNNHGLRFGVAGEVPNPEHSSGITVPEQIDKLIRLPSTKTFDTIIEAFGK